MFLRQQPGRTIRGTRSRLHVSTAMNLLRYLRGGEIFATKIRTRYLKFHLTDTRRL